MPSTATFVAATAWTTVLVAEVEVIVGFGMPLAKELSRLHVPAVGNAESVDELVDAVTRVPVYDTVQAVACDVAGVFEVGFAPAVVVGHDLEDLAQLAGLHDLPCRG